MNTTPAPLVLSQCSLAVSAYMWTGRVVRLIVAVAAFLGAWVGQTSWAEAKSPMCSESAESIAAPPPLVPASDTFATGCESNGNWALGAVPTSDPSPRLASSDSHNPQFAVLSAAVEIAAPMQVDVWPAREISRVSLGEHRWVEPRPPSCA